MLFAGHACTSSPESALKKKKRRKKILKSFEQQTALFFFHLYLYVYIYGAFQCKQIHNQNNDLCLLCLHSPIVLTPRTPTTAAPPQQK